MIEIERKFLVRSLAFKDEAVDHTRIIQGFLNTDPERTVRVRITDNTGVLTIKGISSSDGLSRFEWETSMSKSDALDLLKLCVPGTIEKVRYAIPCGNHTFEVDEFHGDNEGLHIAEIELQHATDTFEKPEWLGEEVTGQLKYYNSNLSKNPYKSWKI